mgnify:CR=1 FL=1|jgi:two-component system sensor histidine kinase DesK
MRWRSFTVPRRALPWLFYLGILVFQPLFDADATWVEWSVTALIALAFLPVYGWTERHACSRPYLWSGKPGGALGLVIMLAMGVLLAPVNAGTSVFFVYAAAIGGQLRPRRLAVRALVATTALVPLAALLATVPFPFVLYPYLPALIFAPVVGVTNYLVREREDQNARLRMAQDEVERLATIAERERIARDLHDLLGHTLSTITLKSELAARLVARDPERAAREIADVERISRDALGQVREAVRGYRSSGLEGELANAKLALEAAGVEYDYYFERLDLSPAAESTLALALREGVTNVVRHAGASRCQVRLEARGHDVVLTVSDDGKLPPDADFGNGLTGMRSRVEALGGAVSLRSTGRSTLLEVKVPLRARGGEETASAAMEAPATA